MTDYFVPFGKYQGNPLDVLINDKKYLQWFLTDCDVYIHHPDIYREIIQRLINPKQKPQTYQKPNDYSLGSPITINPIAERNRMIAYFIDPLFDWQKIALLHCNHDKSGNIMNLKFFANGITAQFDYTNPNIEGFSDKHFSIQMVKELPEDFEPILQSLINLNPDDNHKVILLVDKVFIPEFTEEQIIQIFNSNNIELIIRYPSTNETNSSLDAKDDIPF
ncbi:hypothetical protein QM480_04225 [Flectobacillus sp. DC10W]|uniref:Uncharacterized protein n=1 Tax=Flectobacillus longus TaxID=2984207 RepID=A0ABT6YK36_9BACT|nr:hypothetical protein [Flectobacillus longus]MDI9863516.1 hypothetical protein [Flectobacillus longus]